MRLIGLSQIQVKSFFDEADVAAAFHARDSDIGKVVRVCAKTHVFVQIMSRDVVAPHHGYIALAFAQNNIRLPFDQNAKPMGIECEKSEQAMEQHQDHASPKRREKSR